MKPIDLLKAHIAGRHDVRTLRSYSAEDFVRVIEALRPLMTNRGYPDFELPLLGDHIQGGFGHIADDEFVALCGFDVEATLVTTNTARRYPLYRATLRSFIESGALGRGKWSLDSSDPRFDIQTDAAIHVGTAWVLPHYRGFGLGSAMVALHRLLAHQKLGPFVMFGTTDARKSGKWTGDEKAHGIVTVTDPDSTQHIRLWTIEENVKVAETILSPSRA